MNIQELCLVPKNILENVLASKETNLLRKDKIIAPFNTINTLKPNLEGDLKKIFPTKIKLDNALELYNWIYTNVKDLSLSINGNVNSPLSNFNLIEFIKDVNSNTKNFSKDKLDLYKVWVAMIDLPINFIKNDFLKNHLFPNHYSEKDEDLVKSAKRKITFVKPVSSSKKEKIDVNNENPSPIKTRKGRLGSGKKIKWMTY